VLPSLATVAVERAAEDEAQKAAARTAAEERTDGITRDWIGVTRFWLARGTWSAVSSRPSTGSTSPSRGSKR
jgi:hypothetical protein